jgi:hypothetical protein
MSKRQYFYRNVERLGNVAVTRHAQNNMDEHNIRQELFEDVLLHPLHDDIAEGNDIVWREGKGIRIVIILNPTPARGAKVVKTVYRIQPQAKAR